MTRREHIDACTKYLRGRTGTYAQRCARYSLAGHVLDDNGLGSADTVCDVGAGWTEFDYYLRTKYDWGGRYWPVDGGLDGTDLNYWVPPQSVSWFVALEILEHLDDPYILLRRLKSSAILGVVLSTPNPATTDVLGMDPTHRTALDPDTLREHGFAVYARSFYGQVNDSLFAYWLRDGR